MAKVVYWCVPYSKYFLNVEQPEPLIKELIDLKNTVISKAPESDFIRCPAVHEHVKNTFIIRSPIDLTFFTNGKIVSTKNYDQGIYDELFLLRDVQAGFMSLRMLYSFFFTEEDCEMTLTGAYLSNNDSSKYFTVIPGTFNIAKWFRGLDFAFFIRENNKELTIKRGDPLMYIKFDCKEPIVFKKFVYTKEIDKISEMVLGQKIFQKDKSIGTYLKNVYNIFIKSKLKNKLLIEIKKNLME